MLNSSEDKL